LEELEEIIKAAIELIFENSRR
jgi:hypothetical protein